VLEAEATNGDRREIQCDQNDEHHDGTALHLPPIHVSSQRTAVRFESECLLGQFVASVHQQLDLFPTFQHALDVLDHVVLYLVDLALDGPDVVDGPVGLVRIEIFHPIRDTSLEIFVHGKGDRLLGVFQSKLLQESILGILQEGKGYAMFILFVGHAHVTNPVFDDVVKDVLVVHEGHLFVFLGYFFEQDSSDGREVPGGRSASIFRQDCLLTGNKSVYNSHVVKLFKYYLCSL